MLANTSGAQALFSDELEGFYIVRLTFGMTEKCDHGVWAFGRGEYEVLHRERRLVPSKK